MYILTMTGPNFVKKFMTVIYKCECRYPTTLVSGKACGDKHRCFTWVGPGLALKHWTRLEKLARDKHSSLLRKYLNYGRNKFYSTGPRCQPKTILKMKLFVDGPN